MNPVADDVQQGANATKGAGSASEDLWRFSLTYYARPGVAAALVALQDRERLDVSLILFALWLGTSGRGRLDRQGLTAADRAVRAIRRDIVEPLRALRRRLRSHPDPDIQRLREAVKAIEIEAEKTALHRLAASLAAPDAQVDRVTRLAAAHANLALCLGPDAMRSAEAAVIRDRLALFVAER
ncbi:MAG: TIGR02444 family protein [Stellaceae bacterium]